MTFQKELYTYSAPASIYSKHLGPAFRVGFKGMQKSLGIREIPWVLNKNYTYVTCS